MHAFLSMFIAVLFVCLAGMGFAIAHDVIVSINRYDTFDYVVIFSMGMLSIACLLAAGICMGWIHS